MILWEWDAKDSCWKQTESVGDAGCNNLGYYGGRFNPSGSAILAHGFTGAMHLWEKAESKKNWIPKTAITGHYGSVTDLCLLPLRTPDNCYTTCILSVSEDQTVRILAILDGKLREIGRPQVSLECLLSLDGKTRNFRSMDTTFMG